ncbi:MAG: hypothetical protein Q8N17_17825 [Burkholderiaceae bacterium]|nr:hypothetical protein [Burkholderiaceae bacterium]
MENISNDSTLVLEKLTPWIDADIRHVTAAECAASTSLQALLKEALAQHPASDSRGRPSRQRRWSALPQASGLSSA